MPSDFNDFLEVLQDSPFNEEPVDAKTFVEGENYLAQPPLSSIQYDVVEGMSQIYKKEDLQALMGLKRGLDIIISLLRMRLFFSLARGSGKRLLHLPLQYRI